MGVALSYNCHYEPPDTASYVLTASDSTAGVGRKDCTSNTLSRFNIYRPSLYFYRFTAKCSTWNIRKPAALGRERQR